MKQSDELMIKFPFSANSRGNGLLSSILVTNISLLKE